MDVLSELGLRGWGRPWQWAEIWVIFFSPQAERREWAGENSRVCKKGQASQCVPKVQVHIRHMWCLLNAWVRPNYRSVQSIRSGVMAGTLSCLLNFHVFVCKLGVLKRGAPSRSCSGENSCKRSNAMSDTFSLRTDSSYLPHQHCHDYFWCREAHSEVKWVNGTTHRFGGICKIGVLVPNYELELHSGECTQSPSSSPRLYRLVSGKHRITGILLRKGNVPSQSPGTLCTATSHLPEKGSEDLELPLPFQLPSLLYHIFCPPSFLSVWPWQPKSVGWCLSV